MTVRTYDPSEMTLGPTTSVAFRSNPIALPRRTCLVGFGPLWLVVRIDEVDAEGVAHGNVLGRRKRPAPKGRQERALGEPCSEYERRMKTRRRGRGVPASCFIEAGLEAIQREGGPLA